MELSQILQSDQFLAIVSASFGAFFTLFIAYLNSKSANKQLETQLTHQRKMKWDDTYRSRLEELHVLIGKWSKEETANAVTMVDVLNGRITVQDHMKMILDERNNSSTDTDRMYMIADVYCSDLISQCSAVFKKAQENSVFIASLQRTLVDENDIPENALRKLVEATTEHHEMTNKLLKDIAQNIVD